MTLCINPNCTQPNHSENDTQAHCPTCGAELMIRGRYRVMRLLTDTSGFGLVYEAFARDQPKILKLLKPNHHQSSKAVQLFEQEALVLGRLKHPGVPKIEPDGCFQFTPTLDAEPLHCIIMEKIDGPNLSEWMQQQGNHPISEHQALQWLQQLSEVLHLIHQQQYFHRDIKPDNIMLRSSGQLVLVDFGAVREVNYTYFEQLESEEGVTRISSVGYTAPEQMRGKAVPQSDFYALGCTFIYLLTGRKPMAPEMYDTLTNEFCWRPFAPHISSGLADFIDHLTALRVIDRPPNTLEILTKIGELQHSFTRYTQDPNHPQSQNHQPLTFPGTPAAALETDDPASTKRPMSASSLTPPDPAPLGPIPVGSVQSLEEAATLPPDHTFLGSIHPGSPQQDSQSSSLPSRLQGMNASSPSSANQLGPEDVRRSRDTLMQERKTQIQPALMHQELRRLTQWVVGLVMVLGGMLALWGGRSIYLFAIQAYRPASQTDDLSNHQSAAPNSQTEADTSDAPAPSVLSFSDTRTLEGHTSAVNALAMSLDQSFLASASDDRTVRLWDLGSGQEIRQFVGHGDRVQAVAISPNGQIIISGGGDNLIKLWNLSTGEAVATLSGHSGPINALAITVDGQRLVSASADKTIKVWDLNTHEELTTLVGHKSFVNTLDISPDGALLASGAADRTIKLWDLNTYRETATLFGHESFINTVIFSLNGNALISGGADHQIKIWDYITHEPLHSLSQHTSFVNALAMTMDGQYLVSTSADQTLKIWDLKSQTVLSSLPWPNTLVDTVVIRFTGSTWQILAAGKGSGSIKIWTLDSAD